jgi:hypothetical protein
MMLTSCMCLIYMRQASSTADVILDGRYPQKNSLYSFFNCSILLCFRTRNFSFNVLQTFAAQFVGPIRLIITHLTTLKAACLFTILIILKITFLKLPTLAACSATTVIVRMKRFRISRMAKNHIVLLQF